MFSGAVHLREGVALSPEMDGMDGEKRREEKRREEK
jgi:hypothetical protein